MVVENRCDIEKKLIEIFKSRISIDFGNSRNLRNENFFGNELALPARELALIVLDIEKEFEVTIPKHFFIDHGFTTFHKVLSILKSAI